MKPADMKKPVPQVGEEQDLINNENERKLTFSGKDLITDDRTEQHETLDQSDQGTGRTMATRKVRGFDPAHLQSSRMGEGVYPWGSQEVREGIRQEIEAGREHGAIEAEAKE